MLKKLIAKWHNYRNFVLLDVTDSSVTISHALFRQIQRLYEESNLQPKVFVFYIPSTNCYGFAVSPTLDRPTQESEIQFNSKHKCIGFESLNPTVAKILYDYGLPAHIKQCRLSVTIQSTPQGNKYFQIEKPHAKYTRYHKTI